MAKQNRGPYILAAGAGVQLLTGIPAAWGAFQRPVMQGYGLSRGQAMLVFAVLVASYGVGCAAGGLLQDRRGPRTAGLWGTGLLAGGFLAAALVPPGNAPSLPAGLQPAGGGGQRLSGPGGAGLRPEMVPDQKRMGHRRDRGGHGTFRRILYTVCPSGGRALGASGSVSRRWAGC